MSENMGPKDVRVSPLRELGSAAGSRWLRSNWLIAVAVVWGAFWVLPWADWLEPLPWVRMGLAILLFSVPGMAASIALAGGRFTLAAHFTIGVALSIFLVGSLGLLGRILHLPFGYITPVFFLAGIASLLGISYRVRSGLVLYSPRKYSPLTLALFGVMVALGSLVALQHKFGIDDFSYLAYLTAWQHASRLSFQEVFFNTGTIDAIRFWLAMFPMNLGFLSQVSHLQGLWLFGLYLEPFLVAIALLAAYNLYEDVLQSERQAITAVFLQFTFLFMIQGIFYDGALFFNRLSHDKAFAGFVLAPVFFLLIRVFLETGRRRDGFLTVIAGLSLMLTHPVILAFSIFVAGMQGVFVLVPQRGYRKLAVFLALLVAMILPSASLRVITVPWVSQHILGLESPLLKNGAFDLDSALDSNNIDSRISFIPGTPFYGFNIGRLRIGLEPAIQKQPFWAFLSLSYLWITGIGLLWSIMHLKKSPAAPLIAATSLLVIFCAVPYTGWLVGFFVSARQLQRSVWLLPGGLIGFVLALELQRFAWRRITRRSAVRSPNSRAVSVVICSLCLLLLGYYSIYMYGTKWKSSVELATYWQRLEVLAGLGDYLEQQFDVPARFAAPRGIRDYLPGLSSKAKVAFFRDKRFGREPVDYQKLDSLLSPADAASLGWRIHILEKYRIRYILGTERSLLDYYSGQPQFSVIREDGGFWIVEFLGRGQK